ncbi:unnamed protein product, partial [Staurois parvus]
YKQPPRTLLVRAPWERAAPRSSDGTSVPGPHHVTTDWHISDHYV